ncbi:MAG: hypothetical protein ACSHWZ_11005 [Sulfitobacter sp.]
MTDVKNAAATSGQNIKEKAQAAASSASEEVKARAHDVADTAAKEAANYADQAKGAAAHEVKDVASALRSAAQDMRSGSPQERTFSQIADSLADASDAVRDKDLGEMVGAVSDFARRNPLAFLGGAALIGFAATRFAKASSSAPRNDNDDDEGIERPAPADRGDIPGAGPMATGGLHTPALQTSTGGVK